MFASILAGALTVTLLQAPAAATEEPSHFTTNPIHFTVNPIHFTVNPIHFTVNDGTKRAEFKLNGNMECILENDRISCVPASK